MAMVLHYGKFARFGIAKLQRPDMFNRETWRRQIMERLDGFARNPRQELQLAGAPGLLSFLAAQTLDPFLDAFHNAPIAAVMTLAEITRGPGADLIVRRAARMRYQSAAQLDRELRGNADLRLAIDQLLVELQTLGLARQRLNGAREEWLRSNLERDLAPFAGEFTQLRRVLSDPGGHARAEGLRKLRARHGRFSAADLVLIHDALGDSSAHVRAAAARLLGAIVEAPPPLLAKMLVQVALHDYDAETRFAAARAIGALRDHLLSPKLLDDLDTHLTDSDSFVRSATALVLGQLGEGAGAPALIARLAALLDDPDPYTREAVARALGQIGAPAATADVVAALSRISQDGDIQVYEAATDALNILREIAGRRAPVASAA
jgi:hypothetical protein